MLSREQGGRSELAGGKKYERRRKAKQKRTCWPKISKEEPVSGENIRVRVKSDEENQ